MKIRARMLIEVWKRIKVEAKMLDDLDLLHRDVVVASDLQPLNLCGFMLDGLAEMCPRIT